MVRICIKDYAGRRTSDLVQYIKRKDGGYMLVRADRKWDYALGMIKVDGLEPSPEFKELIKKEKNGEMTTEDMRKVLDQKYKAKK